MLWVKFDIFLFAIPRDNPIEFPRFLSFGVESESKPKSSIRKMEIISKLRKSALNYVIQYCVTQ